MSQQIFLEKTRDLIGNTIFTNKNSDADHALYAIHKCFDTLINYRLLKNDEFTLDCNETMLKLYRIIPPVMPIEFLFRKYDKLWSQEHKCWFHFDYHKREQNIVIKFTIDRVTPPERVFVKEEGIKDVLKDFGLNKWKN